MGDPRAFLNIPRQEAGYRPVNERITDYSQVEQTLNTNSPQVTGFSAVWTQRTFATGMPIGNKQPEAGRFIQREMERGIRNPIVHL